MSKFKVLTTTWTHNSKSFIFYIYFIIIIIIIAAWRGRQWLFHLGLIRFLLAALSLAFWCQELLSMSYFSRFLFTVSLNLSLGLCEQSSCRGIRWWSLLSRCPSHLRFICISMSSIDGRPARFNTSMLVILSFHEMFIIARMCLIMYLQRALSTIKGARRKQ